MEAFYAFIRGHMISTLESVSAEQSARQEDVSSVKRLEVEQVIAFYCDILAQYDYQFGRLIERVCKRLKTFEFPRFSTIPVCDDCYREHTPMRYLMTQAAEV